jgi:hypothetical protein
MPRKKRGLLGWGGRDAAMGHVGHHFKQKRNVVFGFKPVCGPRNTQPRQIGPHLGQGAFIQKPGLVKTAIGQQFASADANEKLEKFLLDL